MIRGQKRTCIQEKPKAITKEIHTSIHNRFDVEVVDSVSGEVKQRAQAENMVLNNFWTDWFSSDSSYFNFGSISVGSGNGTLVATRTTLFSSLGQKSMTDKTFTKNATDKTYVAKGKITILESEYIGSTITEVGLTGFNRSGTIITHAMLKDMNGNPISIVKTNTDIITVYATLYLHWEDSTLNGFTLSDTILKYLIGEAGYFPANCRFIVLPVTGSAVVVGTSLSIAKNTTNHTVTFTCPRVGADVANNHGLKWIAPCWHYSYGEGAEFLATNAPMTWKANDVIVGEAIGTGNGVLTSFSTYFPYAQNAKVYVNGVEQTTGVTVTNSSSYANNVVFSVAPVNGAVITIDYETSVIAKDSNHVFDFSVVITCNEYVV